MLWFFFWAGLLALAAIGCLVLVLLIDFNRRVLVLVHPFTLGLDFETALVSIEEMAKHPEFASALANDEYRREIENKARMYYSSLEKLLSRWPCRLIVLLEEKEFEDVSHLQISVLTPKRWREISKVLPVITRSGRADPVETSWADLLDLLSAQLGARKIEIAGCFLSLNEKDIVRPENRYSCVNDAFYQFLDSGLFPRVKLCDSACFHLEVDMDDVPFGLTAAASKQAM